jgi:hypothetical protein
MFNGKNLLTIISWAHMQLNAVGDILAISLAPLPLCASLTHTDIVAFKIVEAALHLLQPDKLRRASTNCGRVGQLASTSAGIFACAKKEQKVSEDGRSITLLLHHVQTHQANKRACAR